MESGLIAIIVAGIAFVGVLIQVVVSAFNRRSVSEIKHEAEREARENVIRSQSVEMLKAISELVKQGSDQQRNVLMALERLTAHTIHDDEREQRNLRVQESILMALQEMHCKYDDGEKEAKRPKAAPGQPGTR